MSEHDGLVNGDGDGKFRCGGDGDGDGVGDGVGAAGDDSGARGGRSGHHEIGIGRMQVRWVRAGLLIIAAPL